MAGLLKIIATPIGNLGDFSPRAREALASCEVLLAEDTRHSLKLLNYFGIAGPKLLSCNQQNELDRIHVVLERLQAGDNVGLISDAGAPAISDPGGRIAEAVVDAGYRIEVIPGPSAVIAALMGSGLNVTRFAFLGFLPKSTADRERLFKQHAGAALVIFEAPQRVKKTLEDLHEVFGEQRVVVARELTKQFETFHRGRLGKELSPQLVEQGEMVIVVEGGEIRAKEQKAESLTLKEMAKIIAKEQGISSSDAYRLLMKQRNN